MPIVFRKLSSCMGLQVSRLGWDAVILSILTLDNSVINKPARFAIQGHPSVVADSVADMVLKGMG